MNAFPGMTSQQINQTSNGDYVVADTTSKSTEVKTGDTHCGQCGL